MNGHILGGLHLHVDDYDDNDNDYDDDNHVDDCFCRWRGVDWVDSTYMNQLRLIKAGQLSEEKKMDSGYRRNTVLNADDISQSRDFKSMLSVQAIF